MNAAPIEPITESRSAEQSPRRPPWLARAVAGAMAGFVIGQSSWRVGLALTVGALTAVIPFVRPFLALCLLFFGVAMTSDAITGSASDFFAIPDEDIFQGLPPLLTTYLILLTAAAVFNDLILRKRPLSIPLKYLAIYMGITLLAAVHGLMRGNDVVMIRVDFMNMLFPALCFYLCSQILDSAERIRRLLFVLFGAACLKSVLLLAYYLAGRGWPYGSGPDSSYRVATMDSADLLLFITMFLVALALWVERRLRGAQAAAVMAAVIPLLLTILFAYRRAQWVGTVASMGLMFLWTTGAGRARMAAAGALLLALGAGALIFLGVGHEQIARIGQRTLSIVDNKQDSNVYHLLESRQTLKDILQTPVLGLGLGSRHSPLGLYEEDEVPTNIVHNTWLYIWMKAGLPGLLFFIWAACAYLWRILRCGRLKQQPLLLALASSFGLWMAMFLTGPVPWYFHQTYLMALFASMTIALCGMELPSQNEPEPS